MAASALMVSLVLILSFFTTIQSNKADKYHTSTSSTNLSNHARDSLQVGTNSCLTSFECFGISTSNHICYHIALFQFPNSHQDVQVVQKLLSLLNVNSVNTKQEAGGTYIATIRQLMSRLGSAPDIARRGILIMW